EQHEPVPVLRAGLRQTGQGELVRVRRAQREELPHHRCGPEAAGCAGRVPVAFAVTHARAPSASHWTATAMAMSTFVAACPITRLERPRPPNRARQAHVP